MKSILTRADYDDFVIRLYFGRESDRLLSCINRAYLDFNRTLHGLAGLTTKTVLHSQVRDDLRRMFHDLQNGDAAILTQDDFDQWHRHACEHLVASYGSHGHGFFVGQAQKWLNMTVKYIYTMGEQRLPGFARYYELCHVPLDKGLIAKLAPYGFPRLSCAWSRINDYDQYQSLQVWVRQRFQLPPLDVEFLLWLNRGIDASYLVKG